MGTARGPCAVCNQPVPSLAQHYLLNPVVRDWLGPKPYYILMYLTYGE